MNRPAPVRSSLVRSLLVRSLLVRSLLVRSLLVLAVSVFCVANGAAGEEPRFPLNAKRIVFLGDSITHAGGYITWVETQLRLQGVEPMPELINLGLSSETCSGLSEPDHPFPRPDVHERLDRVLATTQPDVVVACYGMNDGIYHPFDEGRFAAYRRGIEELIRKSQLAGADVVLMTPPPFDAAPVGRAGKLRALDEPPFAYFAVYEDYDDVIRRYGRWLLGDDETAAAPNVEMVIDLHRPISRWLEGRRRDDPTYTVAPDGVHPNADGHRRIARTILERWGIESWTEPPDGMWETMSRRGRVLHDAWLSHVGHERPGVKPGLPLPEAERVAAELEAEIDRLVRRATGGGESR